MLTFLRQPLVLFTLFTVAVLSIVLLLYSVAASAPDAPDNQLKVTTGNSLPGTAARLAELVPARDTSAAIPADAATILARKQIPILCYHQLRNWRTRDSEMAKTYIVEEENFRNQIKMLADSGYHTILPDELYDYLVHNKPLPEKPVMLTFDDTNLDHYKVAAPVLEQYGFKGVFFVMTVSLGRPNYMSKAQVKALSDSGHIIGSHTWDHQNVKKYEPKDWITQIENPSRQLQEITGKPVQYFAYPFGLWNEQAIPELKKRNFKAAFQLATSRDASEPLFTIRRIIASGYWSPRQLHNSMINSF
ncbi:polysaccharide deacetylase family protein [Pontibacter sp. KCTC 32443]|uniref:polysaccharide deacetylase family protein n=1 Tax=Pontibacter TaxID=323449 RepID=UPI00164E4CF9|nr:MULTISPECIES: polysaccharide deacetylase family protein [Pontibacter]MBC5774753.1 polysaccharide deacetylase family protein [Pontibacter sp. KCTC 32443]